MKINKLILSAAIALGGVFTATAQQATVEESVFQPHWYIMGQVGGQETLGETSFGRLAAFNAQIGVGYRFNSVLGARLIFNGYTSKGSVTVFNNRSDWKWNYIAPTANLTVDLTNLIGGFNPDRLVSAGIFGGVGANIAWNNKEANDVNKALQQLSTPPATANMLQLVWDGTKARFLGQFGAFCDFNVTNNLKIGIELQANVLPDGYNSKKAYNADWYFNGLVGVKYAFGTTSRKVTKAVPVVRETEAEAQVIEKIVEVPVEKIVIKEVIKEVPAPLTRDVFFKISTYKITKDEMYKVAEVARYMKNNPSTKVTITGYADKGTGTMAINLRLSAQRAEIVKNALVKDYGIDESRILVKSMGETEDQPYSTPAMNRVAICVVE